MSKVHDVLLRLVSELERSPVVDRFELQNICGQIASLHAAGSQQSRDAYAASAILLVANAMYQLGKAEQVKIRAPIRLELIASA